MYRLFLTCSLVFVFSLFVAHAQQQLVFEKVTVDTLVQQEIELSWQFNPSIDSVTIYKCTKNCNVENNHLPMPDKVPMESNKLRWIDDGEDPTHCNYYSIGYNIGANGSGKIDIQNNMVLEASSEGCKNSILLEWTPYTKISFNPSYNITSIADTYNIFYRKIDSSFVWLNSITSNDTTNIVYHVQHLENETQYEFVIQAVSTNFPALPFSNIVRRATGYESDMLVPVIISRVNVIEDKEIEIDVHTKGDFDPFTFIKLDLYRGIDSINYNIIASSEEINNTYTFIDDDANPKSSLYYYKAIAKHQCRADDISNILTNIHLKGNRIENEKYKDRIIFDQRGVDLSEPYHLWINKQEFSTDYPLTAENNEYVIDVAAFINEGNEIVYKIISANNDAYSNKQWESNTVTIPREPVVIPNAFYPNGYLFDKTFHPIIYPQVDNYELIIYNRWGQKLYPFGMQPDYNDFNSGWDGTFQGSECPAGIYVYQLSFTYKDGKRFSKSGSFMLVR